MRPTGRGLAGLGIGLAAAGAATAVGVAADRVNRDRIARYAVLAPEGAYAHSADKELAVLADDGIPLHVEIDEPDPQQAATGRPTVVFSHGYTLSLKSWVLQRKALTAAGYRVVLWDQRSHGRSEKAPAESCTLDQLGRDLHQVLQEAVPDGPLVLVGHSMGGMTVMAMAQQFPEVVRDRVVAVAFVATSAGGENMVTLGFGQFIGRLLGRIGPRFLARLGARQQLLGTVRRFGRDVEDLIVDHYSFASPVSQTTVRYTGDMIFGTPLQVMADFLPSINMHDKRAALEAFHGVETLVLNGMQDLLTPPSHSEAIVRLVPGAEHVVVEDAGHIIMLEHPDVVTEQLVQLVERGMRAAGEGIEVEAKPRVRRTVTDLAKRRRVASARRQGRRGA
ncbi:alpha/beta fold hydrolase [Pedococcus sp. 5OH_020]|uniref:alpha/beta fold hydrolase n=1 Tax=Pedococcus sp. 5OH_020 TaxID=2989814 RepID=UPI0022E9C216|nr:alpha/beta hydrolase [Pedococcus sp. 5OH_020]